MNDSLRIAELKMRVDILARQLDEMKNTSSLLHQQIRGKDGEDGVAGLQGGVGPQGPAGPVGPQGPAGPSGGGGSAAKVFYALGSGTANLGTSLGTVPLAAASRTDTGYTFAGNEVTIGAELDGMWATITWAVSGTGATNRVELRSELQINGVAVKTSANYTARNSTQNIGGIQGFHHAQLAAGDVIRIQALRDGSTANLVPDGTHLFIEAV